MTKIVADGYVWRAELTIGTMQGYSGPEVVKPGDLVPLIQEFQSQRELWFPAIVWTRGTVLGPAFPPETVIRVSMESNPLYSRDADEQDVGNYACLLANFLGKKLSQVRVYVATYGIRSQIVEQ